MPKHRLDHSVYFQNQACPKWGRTALPRGPCLQRSTPHLLGGDLMQGFAAVLALEPRVLPMLGVCSTTDQHPSLWH